MRRLYFFFLAIILIQSCVDTGEKRIEYYPDGRLKAETIFIDDRKNGKAVEYYPSGNIKTISHFENDTLDGIQETFFDNGKLSAKISFVKGDKTGSFSSYHKNGSIASSGFFKNGLRQGHFYEYHYTDSGRIKSDAYIIIADNEEYLYYFREFDENGKLLNEVRSLKVEKSNKGGKTDVIQLRILYVDTIEYDSIKVLVGPYTPQFELPPGSKVDTLSFMNNEAKFTLELTSKKDTTIRGKFLGYRTFVDSDTIVNSTRVEFFEDKVQF